jgi:hypothetical protein
MNHDDENETETEIGDVKREMHCTGNCTAATEKLGESVLLFFQLTTVFSRTRWQRFPWRRTEN